MRFEELTDDQWKLLVPSIPAPAHTGRPRADDRSSTINGILYVLISECRASEEKIKEKLKALTELCPIPLSSSGSCSNIHT